MAASKEVLEWYREQTKRKIGEINDQLEAARWRKHRALAEEQLVENLSPADVEVAKEVGVLISMVTSSEAQAQIDELQAKKDALQRLMGKTQ